jgi:hypothetical protein
VQTVSVSLELLAGQTHLVFLSKMPKKCKKIEHFLFCFEFRCISFKMVQIYSKLFMYIKQKLKSDFQCWLPLAGGQQTAHLTRSRFWSKKF